MTSLRTRTCLLAAGAAVLALAACTDGSNQIARNFPSNGSSSDGGGGSGGSHPGHCCIPSPAGKVVNPLTGGPASKHGVVAVKIDDTANGRPQRNIDKANVVYIEEVEGGLTRLLAIYNSSLPTVEPVRSTRANDPELAAEYGPIAYVASGGASNPLAVLRASKLKTTIGDFSGPGFARDNSRYAPYNLTSNLTTVAHALHPPRAKYVGFQWRLSKAQLTGRPGGYHVRTTVGSTPIDFEYQPTTHHYVRYIDGQLQRTAGGQEVSTANVIVQFCTITPYLKDIDVNGNPSMYTHTIGRGRATVFRNGKRLNGTWKRSKLTGPTRFTDANGKTIFLRPGGVWVVLAAKSAHLAGPG